MLKRCLPVLLVVLICGYSQFGSFDLSSLYSPVMERSEVAVSNATIASSLSPPTHGNDKTGRLSSGSSAVKPSPPSHADNSKSATSSQSHISARTPPPPTQPDIDTDKTGSRSTSTATLSPSSLSSGKKNTTTASSNTAVPPPPSQPHNASAIKTAPPNNKSSPPQSRSKNTTITARGSHNRPSSPTSQSSIKRMTATANQSPIKGAASSISRSERLQISNITAIPRSDRFVELSRAIYGEQYDKNVEIEAHYSPTSPMNRNNQSRHLFLHIGKAGGTSLVSGLKMKKMMARLHGSHLLHASREFDFVDDFLVVLRSPIDRMVSWFYFELMHSLNKALVRKRGAISYRGIIFSCFSEVQELAQALTNTSATCHQLALHIVHGIGPPDGITHMFHNIMFYTRQGLLKRPDLPVYVMRTKQLWSDFTNIFGDPGKNVTDVKADHGTVKKDHDSSIAPELMRPLCCAFVEELDAYRYILFRAENNISATETLAEALSLCDVTSLEQLVDECPNYLLHPNYQDPGTNTSLTIDYPMKIGTRSV